MVKMSYFYRKLSFMMTRLITLLGLMVVIWGCRKAETDLTKTIAFYNLKEFQTQGPGCAIDEASVKVGNEILIGYKDIISYDPEAAVFTIPESLAREISGDRFQNHYYQKPFALAIGKDIIYTGYFWSNYSSTGCNWIVAVPLANQLRISLAYPGHTGQILDDRRNDSRVLEILRRDGKLVE